MIEVLADRGSGQVIVMMPIVNADSRIESALHLRSAAAKNVLADTGGDPGRRLLDGVARAIGMARGGLRPRTAE